MDYKFNIANIRIQVTAPQPLDVGKKWQAFAADFARAELQYTVEYLPELRTPEGEEVFSNRHVRVTQRDGLITRSYIDESANEVLLTVCQNEPAVYHIRVKPNGGWGRRIEDILEAFGLSHCLPQRGVLLLHCAYVLHRGYAILFTAPSGTGKSTQAALWERHLGSCVVNGDRAALGLEQGKLMAYGLPLSGSSEACRNVTAPVIAAVGLSQAKENRLERLTVLQTTSRLMNGTYLLPEFSADRGMLLDLALTLAQRVKGFHLSCLPDTDAVDLLADALF